MATSKIVIELSDADLKKILCKHFYQQEPKAKVIVEKKVQQFPFAPEAYTIKLEIEI